MYHLLGHLSWVIKSFQDRPGTNAVPFVSILHASVTIDTVPKVESIVRFPVKVSCGAKCCNASNMAISLLGTDKKYIIYISTDPQIAWHTSMCKICINL